MRLQKYMAHAGIGSRRKCEEIIAQGHVEVNGKRVTEQGYIVKEGDVIKVDGKILSRMEEMKYILLNKPRGVLSTAKDERGRQTVLDCVEERETRLYPVGRLDRDSSGLILLTNDGALAQKLTHPSHEIEKTYLATVVGRLSERDLIPLREGIELEEGKTAPGYFKVKERRGDKTRVICKIHEGKNRQIRRMFDAIGHEVVNLERVAMGPLNLGRLGRGQYRELNSEEIKELKKIK